MTVYGVRGAQLDGDPPGDLVELFLRREGADTFLADCLHDEPDWSDVLTVVAVDLGS